LAFLDALWLSVDEDEDGWRLRDGINEEMNRIYEAQNLYNE